MIALISAAEAQSFDPPDKFRPAEPVRGSVMATAGETGAGMILVGIHLGAFPSA
jgi:hypothetical protein